MLSNSSILISGGTRSFGHTFVPMTLKVQSKEELLGVYINKIHDYKVNYKFNFINNFHHTNDISFIIGNKKPWGKGYSNEAVKLC